MVLNLQKILGYLHKKDLIGSQFALKNISEKVKLNSCYIPYISTILARFTDVCQYCRENQFPLPNVQIEALVDNVIHT